MLRRGSQAGRRSSRRCRACGRREGQQSVNTASARKKPSPRQRERHAGQRRSRELQRHDPQQRLVRSRSTSGDQQRLDHPWRRYSRLITFSAMARVCRCRGSCAAPHRQRRFGRPPRKAALAVIATTNPPPARTHQRCCRCRVIVSSARTAAHRCRHQASSRASAASSEQLRAQPRLARPPSRRSAAVMPARVPRTTSSAPVARCASGTSCDGGAAWRWWRWVGPSGLHITPCAAAEFISAVEKVR